MALDDTATKEPESNLGSGEPEFHYKAPTYHYEAIRGLVTKKAWGNPGRKSPRRGQRRKLCKWAVGLPQTKTNAKNKDEM